MISSEGHQRHPNGLTVAPLDCDQAICLQVTQHAAFSFSAHTVLS